MKTMSQQLLIHGTVIFLISLVMGFTIPALSNARMGVSAHVAGIQSGIMLWAFGAMWVRVALPDAAKAATQVLALVGAYGVFLALLLAAIWGTSKATPIAGAGHSATQVREMTVTIILTTGSLAATAATALLLWGLYAWRA
jgi:hydroxylaminobenzene mutase